MKKRIFVILIVVFSNIIFFGLLFFLYNKYTHNIQKPDDIEINHEEEVITPINIENSALSGVFEHEYTGGEVYIPFVLSLNGKILQENIDYDVSYYDNINIGIATIKATGKGNYSGTKLIYFSIVDSSSSKAVITCQNKVYNGQNQIIATCAGGTIKNAEKRTIGSYLVECDGDSNHENAQPTYCYIGEISISSASISSISDQVFSGNYITPIPTVKVGKTTLTKGKDYVVKYFNNINIGRATLVVIGIGKYAGEKSITFNIINNVRNNNITTKKAEVNVPIKKTLAVITCQNNTYNGQNQVIAKCSGGTIEKAVYKSVGRYLVECKGDNNHYDAQSKYCSISEANISSATIFTVADQPYRGSSITPSPTIKMNDLFLEKGKDYTLSYNNNNKIGAAKITIHGIGSYTGTTTTIFQIVEDESLVSPVSDVALREVAFEDLSKVVAVNDSITVTPNMKPETSVNRNLVWTSSNNNIATVSPSGRVIGRKEGKVTITATAKIKNSHSADSKVVSSYDVYVCNNPLDSDGMINNSCFGINPNNQNVVAGEQNSKGLTAAIDYSLENSKRKIILKNGKYYFKAVEFSNSGSQKYPFAVFIANNTTSSINIDLGNSTLFLMANNYSRGSMIYIGEASNITVSNGVLVGDAKAHVCPNGTYWIDNQSCAESYHGVYVHSGVNVELNNLKIYDVIGDGVYVYGQSNNVNVINSTIYDTGRNGVTATFGSNIYVKKNTIHNNNWGVKVEPTKDQYELDQFPVKTLIIEDNVIYDSRYHGSVYLFRCKNVSIKGNKLADIVSSSYCGDTRDETDYNSKCFAGSEINNVHVSNNSVYVLKNKTYITPELVNINCTSGSKGCVSSIPWRKVSGDWYYINSLDGTLKRSAWIMGTGNGDKKNKWYYVNSSGKRYVDTTVIIDGEEFEFDSNGICTHGSFCEP